MDASDSSDGNDDDQKFNVACVHAVAGFAVFHVARYGWNKWCRRKQPETQEEEGGPTAKLEQLQPQKRLFTAYALLFSGGLVGAHHFYLDRLVHGLLAAWSLNFLLLGYIVDFFMMPSYVRGFNGRRVHTSAPLDSSRGQLCVKLPLTALACCAALVCIVLGTPWVLHRTGVVDIDRLAAQTEINPYDTLEITRSASLAEAKLAYRKLSLKWHPDRNQGCGKECDHKMSEITKAFDLIKTRRAPINLDKTWDAWFREIGQDWWYVMEVFSAKYNKDEEPNTKKPARNPKEKKANETKTKKPGKSADGTKSKGKSEL